MPSFETSSFQRYSSRIIAPATGAVNSPFIRLTVGEVATIKATGGVLGAGESAAIMLYDPENPTAPYAHKQGASAVVVDADNTARTIYGPLHFRVEKTITSAARGIEMIT